MPRGTDRYDEAVRQGRLWEPHTAGLQPVAYINFNRPETLSFGTGIATARSLGGGVSFTQATGTQQLTLTTVNGSVRVASAVAASQQRLETASTGITSAAFTICGLARYTPGGTAGRVFTGSTANTLWGFHGGVAERWYDTDEFLVAGSTSDVEWHVIVCRSTASGVASMRNNGAPAINSVVGTQSYTGSGGFHVGGGSPFSEYSDCQIFAFAVFNSALSDSDIERIEGQWMWEARLLDLLSASHPFKNRPPLIGG